MLARAIAFVFTGFFLFPLSAAASEPRPGPAPDRPVSGPVEHRVAANLGFQRWIDGFRPRARAAGISARSFDAAFAGVEYDTNVISRDRNQAEFSKPLWEYLDGAVSAQRIATGRQMLARYAQTLAAIEAKYGVEKEVVVAVWGLESSYGAVRGSTQIIPALATLAYDGRRGDFFEAQLIAALKILQAGDVSARGMRGSWAGAMGHTQFMPTSYLDHAVDFTGDGRRDIWSDNPTDALASTAAYLKHFGWTKGQPWGIEVRLPAGFDFAKAGHEGKRPIRAWSKMGVRSLSGQEIKGRGKAAILLPAGARGPAFMIFKNFNVIEAYNGADSYVIAVGHLSDRLRGRPAFTQPWPRGERVLSFAERRELQQRLNLAGFSTKGVDGRIGPNTIQAIRKFQQSAGLVADGYPSPALLQALR